MTIHDIPSIMKIVLPLVLNPNNIINEFTKKLVLLYLTKMY